MVPKPTKLRLKSDKKKNKDKKEQSSVIIFVFSVLFSDSNSMISLIDMKTDILML